MSLVVVVTCNRLFTRATCKDWAAVYGEENVFCYLDVCKLRDLIHLLKQMLVPIQSLMLNI